MRAPIRSSSIAGATLVELLAALGIGALIIGAIVLAHYTLTQNAALQLDRIEVEKNAHHTMDAFREDLLQLFATDAEPRCAIELENSATNLIVLGFCRWERIAIRELPMTNRLEHVVFKPAPADERPGWIKIRHALAGPDAALPPVTNRLDAAWPRLLVHLHDGSEWKTNWPSGTDARPRAARVMLLDSTHQPAYETMIVIPSGLSVTSSITRAGRILNTP